MAVPGRERAPSADELQVLAGHGEGSMKGGLRGVIGKHLAHALLSIALAAIAGCAKQPQTSNGPQVSPVAQTGPKLEPLPPTPPPKPLRPRVASEGDCGPRYPNGDRGTCINNQPCRGYGERNPDGKAVCTCFGLDGGCAEGLRCDNQRLKCVPENEPPFGRAVPD